MTTIERFGSLGAVQGLAGASYGPFAGIALEPQCWPDAPNRAWAHQVHLAPGDAYRQVSVFRFGSGACA
jgi:aldose 1-epimerase